MGRSKSAKIKNQAGTELTVQQHETESPLIPVGQLKEIHTFRPDLVDWVVRETQKESEWRRAEGGKVNKFIFVERTIGQIFGLAIGLGALLCGSYVAINSDTPWIGATIAAIGISGLATAFISFRGSKSNKD